MIDTIQFGMQDFIINKENKLTTKLFINNKTKQTYQSSFYNDEILNININEKGLSVKTNLSKLYGLGDNNFYPLGQNSINIAIKRTIPKLLSDIGIKADINKAKIWRLDLFKNAFLSEPCLAYKDVLNSLNLKRTHNRQYPDGYLIANGQREVMFYDKKKELESKLGIYYIKEMGLNEKNIMRGELRLLKHRENKKNGIEYLIEIPDKWNLLKEIYNKIMREIFKYEYEGGLEMNVETLKVLVNKAMIDLIVAGKEALEFYGLYPYTFVNRNELKNALNIHYKKAQMYKILSDIEEARKKFIRRDKDYKKLYDELKAKFVA